MEKIYLVVFSLDRDPLLEYINQVKSVFERQGAGYSGPATFERFTFRGPLNEPLLEERLDSAPNWVQSLEFRDEDYARLRSSHKAGEKKITVFGRGFMLTDQRATQEAMSVPLPDTVCLHVEVDTIDQYSGGKYTPFTFDPARDHVTDSD